MYNTTELYQALKAAEAAFANVAIDAQAMPLLRSLEIAEAAYHEQLSVRRAQWAAVPTGEAKDSAEQNAYDTEGTAIDQLRWFEIALGTYEEILSY